MNTFLLDLWHDLRAKRLWPVAVLLAAALVAVPVLLKKHPSSPSSPSSPSAAASAAGADASKAVVVAATDTSKNSTLGVFNKKDPFRPDKAVLAAAHPKAPAQQSSAPAPSTPSSSGGSTPSGAGGSSGDTVNTGGGSTGGSRPQPTKPQKPKGPYAYTVDVRFGRFGETRVHHNVQKLDVLPNQNNPLLVFLGVNTAGDTAVFLTDTSLKAAGEGTCKPDGNTCSFLYLKLDKDKNSEDLSEQAADGSGTEYTLTLLAIHKVPVSELAKDAKKAAKAARKAALQAHIEHHKQPTPFKVPLRLQLQADQVG